MAEEIVTDVLVVGTGAAGLCAAIAAREENAETLMASIAAPGAGNSTALSGAIMNAAVGADDSPEIHFDDTIRGGAYINDRPLVAKLTEEMPGLVAKLEECGVGFQKDGGRHTLFRSPGHTRARTLSFLPKIGTTLSKPLAQTAQQLGAKTLANFYLVKVLVEDGRAVGAIGYDWTTDEIIHVSAKVVILATGGASMLYSRTRIPPGVPGDGYGVGLEAGLTLQDVEFVQFYPTILAEPGIAKAFLAYDQFLNVGVVLRNSLGEDIIAKHGLPEPVMITRDQLAIAMAREIYDGRGVDGTILMDGTGCKAAFEKVFFERTRVGGVIRERKARGEDLLARPVKVAPANHYYMGGIQSGINGETPVEGLLVCGEVAGGTQGANRLQGNSLTETVVMGFAAGRLAGSIAGRLPKPAAQERTVAESRAQIRAALRRESGTPVREIIEELQSVMTSKAAVIREGTGLQEAKAAIDEIRKEIPRAIALAPRERGHLCIVSQLLDAAEAIVLSALHRCESRGAHFRLDFPQRDDAVWTKHVTCSKRGGDLVTSTCPVRLT